MSCLSEFKIHISPMRTCIIVGDYSGLTKFRFRLPDSLFNSPNFEVHTFFLGGGGLNVPGGDSRLKNCKQKITLDECLLSLFLCPYLQLNEVFLLLFNWNIWQRFWWQALNLILKVYILHVAKIL